MIVFAVAFCFVCFMLFGLPTVFQHHNNWIAQADTSDVCPPARRITIFQFTGTAEMPPHESASHIVICTTDDDQPWKIYMSGKKSGGKN